MRKIQNTNISFRATTDLKQRLTDYCLENDLHNSSCYSPSFGFLLEAGDEGENAKAYGGPIIPQACNHNRMRRR